jgi:hypothetical protein
MNAIWRGPARTASHLHAPHGFAALEFFDRQVNGGNANGAIDSGDDIFQSLVAWIDANHDGISQAEELKTLRAVGVISIEYTAKEAWRRDSNGNVFRYRAPMRIESKGDRIIRYAYDVFLESR